MSTFTFGRSRVVLLLIAVVLMSCGGQEDSYKPNKPTPYNVIFVTLDGVRWEELFNGSDSRLTAHPSVLFPTFWSKIAPRGKVYGNPRVSSMRVATVANASLPGYTSIFAEDQQDCLTNFCKRITVPTFLDRLRDELDIPQQQLAVFASWSKLRLAVTGRDDVAFVHAGGYDLSQEASSPQHALLEQTFETDRGTVLNGFEYLKQHPRFLYLSFLDSDRYGHQNQYERYIEVLQSYDRLLGELVDRLDASGEYGRNTAIVVATDHGRGAWEQWTSHGPQIPASARVWAFVMLPPAASELSLEEPHARSFNHHDLRYTIETLFGLSTTGHSGYSKGFIRQTATNGR